MVAPGLLAQPPLQPDARKQNESSVAVGAKELQRGRRVRALDLRGLPGEMRAKGEPADPRYGAPAGKFNRCQRQRRARRIEKADPERHSLAEQAGGRADAD